MQAEFFRKLGGEKVQCNACNHYCVLENNEFGKCLVRQNRNGALESLAFGKPAAMHLDPIEKKPLFHYKPGSKCLSFGTLGCNFKCDFCQNSEMSQEFSEKDIENSTFVKPEAIVELALAEKAQGIAYTYNEPTVFAEYALETMKPSHKKGLYNAWVSNGFMTDAVLEAIAPFLDAINIDLKGPSEFYKKLCGGKREVVEKNIEWICRRKVHLELTYLIVPGFNDKKQDFRQAAEFILSLSEKIPLHFSAFYPQYKMQHIPATEKAKVLEAQKIAQDAGLKYVYAGNLGIEENSYCPSCKSLLVERKGHNARLVGFDGKKCAKCGLDLGKDFVI